MTCQTSGNIYPNTVATHSFQDIIEEMRLLEIDIKPYFEIAAHDIFNRYGINAGFFAQLILDQMTEDNDPDGIYLWQELSRILINYLPPSQITLH